MRAGYDLYDEMNPRRLSASRSQSPTTGGASPDAGAGASGRPPRQPGERWPGANVAAANTSAADVSARPAGNSRGGAPGGTSGHPVAPQRTPVTDTLIGGFAPIRDLPPEPDAGWDGAPGSPTGGGRTGGRHARRSRSAFVVGVIVVAALLGAAVFVAVREARSSAGTSAAGGAPAASAGPVGASPGLSGGAGGSPLDAGARGDDDSLPPDVVAGEALRWGTVRLSATPGAADEAFDLDTGTADSLSSVPASRWPDLLAVPTGLSTLNGAGYAAWTGAGAPAAADCRIAGSTGWLPTVALAALTPKTTICLVTSDARIGRLTVDVVQGQPGSGYTLELTYVVWRKAGE